ncbi:hypothetical protein D3C87_1190370 [compost metagenome]
MERDSNGYEALAVRHPHARFALCEHEFRATFSHLEDQLFEARAEKQFLQVVCEASGEANTQHCRITSNGPQHLFGKCVRHQGILIGHCACNRRCFIAVGPLRETHQHTVRPLPQRERVLAPGGRRCEECAQTLRSARPRQNLLQLRGRYLVLGVEEHSRHQQLARGLSAPGIVAVQPLISYGLQYSISNQLAIAPQEICDMLVRERIRKSLPDYLHKPHRAQAVGPVQR